MEIDWANLLKPFASATRNIASISRANPQRISPETIEALVALLGYGPISDTRNQAGNVLFEIVYGNPQQAESIMNQLEIILASSQPHRRIAAARTLEMISIGNLVEEARASPENFEQIEMRLIIYNSYFYDEIDMMYAASIAFGELKKLKLINIDNLVKEARANPDNIEQVKLRLIPYTSDYYNNDEVGQAANVALEELRKIDVKRNK